MTQPTSENVERYYLKDDGTIPNNPRLPVLVYRRALGEKQDLENLCRDLFRGNGWSEGLWLNGIYDYWHYHSRGHEALGCVGGKARVGVGGPAGAEIEMERGDVVVLPAGTGHKCHEASDDFQVIGAYPPGQYPDMLTGQDGEYDAAVEAIADLPDPESDPVEGRDGLLVKLARTTESPAP